MSHKRNLPMLLATNLDPSAGMANGTRVAVHSWTVKGNVFVSLASDLEKGRSERHYWMPLPPITLSCKTSVGYRSLQFLHVQLPYAPCPGANGQQGSGSDPEQSWSRPKLPNVCPWPVVCGVEPSAQPDGLMVPKDLIPSSDPAFGLAQSIIEQGFLERAGVPEERSTVGRQPYRRSAGRPVRQPSFDCNLVDDRWKEVSGVMLRTTIRALSFG